MRVDRDVELKWENMLAGIRAQPRWLRSGPAALHEQARRIPGPAPARIYLVGCGDSHYCGLGTRLAFERWTGVPTEALESLEFSRYVAPHAPSDSLVVCVSNSGRVARTVESAMIARERGMTAIALTFDATSRLGTVCDHVLTFGYEDVGFGPGTLSYVTSLAGLYVIALRVAELRGRMTEAGVAGELAALAGQADVLEAAIASGDPVAERLGSELDAGARVHIIGGGPSQGTALFGMAKLIEAAALPAVGQELEEWAHEQYFCTGPGTLTVVVAPPGAATDRAREQLAAVRDVGGTSAVVCHAGDAETAAMADAVLPIGEVPEELSPLAYCIPLELLAYHFATSKGAVMLGFDDARRMEVNFRQIFGSRIAGAEA
jgi:glucosamine 6-phosphate synthetase-like amidotransferase/phosphosugar isomerase protein